MGLDVTQHGERAYVFDSASLPTIPVVPAPAPVPEASQGGRIASSPSAASEGA